MITNYVNDIKSFTNEFDSLDIFAHQAFLVKLYQIMLFVENNEVSDTEQSSISNALRDFLCKFNANRGDLTIKEFNLVFGPPVEMLDLNDENIYIILYNLLAGELRTPGMIISFKVKELISNVVERIMKEAEVEESINSSCDNRCQEPDNIHPNTFNEPSFNNCASRNDIFNKQQDIFSRKETCRPPEFYPTFDNFVIKNKDYLKEYIVRNGLIEYKCSCCGLTSWQNNPLMLHLHSKSGIYSNKNLNDLEFLCPNCYSQIGD